MLPLCCAAPWLRNLSNFEAVSLNYKALLPNRIGPILVRNLPLLESRCPFKRRVKFGNNGRESRHCWREKKFQCLRRKQMIFIGSHLPRNSSSRKKAAFKYRLQSFFSSRKPLINDLTTTVATTCGLDRLND